MLTLKMYEAAKKAAQRHELANWLENHHQMQLIILSTDRTKVGLLVGCSDAFVNNLDGRTLKALMYLPVL